MKNGYSWEPCLFPTGLYFSAHVVSRHTDSSVPDQFPKEFVQGGALETESVLPSGARSWSAHSLEEQRQFHSGLKNNMLTNCYNVFGFSL